MKICKFPTSLLPAHKEELPRYARQYDFGSVATQEQIDAILARELQGQSIRVFTPADIDTPCVYFYLNSDEEILYVGCSTWGVLRAFRSTMSREDRALQLEAVNKIVVVYYEEEWQAKEAEYNLIQVLKPPMNKQSKL